MSTLGWQWVFWINVPFGIVGAVAGWLILPQTAHLAADKRFDVKGALLLGPMLTAFMIVLNEGQTWGAASPAFIAAAADRRGRCSCSCSGRSKARADAPLLDPRLFDTPRLRRWPMPAA